MNPNSVVAHNFCGWMHQGIGQSAICRKQQKSRSGHIKPADSNPTGTLESWQAIEDTLAAFRVGASGNFVTGFVVHEVPVLHSTAVNAQWPAIERDVLATLQRLAKRGHTTVNLEATFPNPLFDSSPRSMAGCGKYFLNPVSHR